MLEVILTNEFYQMPHKEICDVKKHDLNRLKEHLDVYGAEYILDALIEHNVDYLTKAGNFYRWRDQGLYDFSKITSQIANQPANDEEKTFAGNLNKLQRHLYSLNRKEFESLNGDDQDKYAINFGTKCAEILETSVSGYMSLERITCPACPNAEKEANWDDWKKLTSPMNYWVKNQNIRFEPYDERGIIWRPVSLSGKPFKKNRLLE